jgi:hypothetical protein
MFPWMGFDVLVVARLPSFPGGHDRGRSVVADTLNGEADRGPPNWRRRRQRRWSQSQGETSNPTKSHVVSQPEVQRRQRLPLTSAPKCRHRQRRRLLRHGRRRPETLKASAGCQTAASVRVESSGRREREKMRSFPPLSTLTSWSSAVHRQKLHSSSNYVIRSQPSPLP